MMSCTSHAVYMYMYMYMHTTMLHMQRHMHHEHMNESTKVHNPQRNQSMGKYTEIGFLWLLYLVIFVVCTHQSPRLASLTCKHYISLVRLNTLSAIDSDARFCFIVVGRACVHTCTCIM